jgi:DNA-binding NarL/FixJ family response regulator
VSTFARRVLIVEDEPLFASLVLEVLEREGFVVSVTDNVATARSLITKWDPDLVLLDVALGAGPPGTQLAYYVGKKHPGIAILFLTRHPDIATAGIDPALVPAESGFLRKDQVADSAYLLDAIDKVLTNKADQVRHSFANGSPLAVLTPTQLEVLKMVAQGLNNQAIANRRKITVRSVEKNLHSIFSALGLSGDDDTNLRVRAAITYVTHAGPPASDKANRP